MELEELELTLEWMNNEFGEFVKLRIVGIEEGFNNKTIAVVTGEALLELSSDEIEFRLELAKHEKRRQVY